MNAIFKTDRGRVRRHNEDDGGVFFNSNDDYLVIVADGMGGHKAGDVASKMAVASLSDFWSSYHKVNTPDEAEKWFKAHVPIVNREILYHANNNEQCKGMGTTLVAAICTDRFATVVNIGDSRCYLMNENGFQQLTEDHTLVNELVKTGMISHEDAEHHPRKNVVLKAVGAEPVIDMDIKTITFEDDDILLLCSDGLSNKISKEELSAILKEDETLDKRAETLIEMANQKGGEDNITLAIIEYRPCPESRCDEC